ncbi:hypothetical protein CHL67_06920 [Prosthecochloris sp. GSB1]|uniref:hypothetical protein n=1 Tax=Prosthecochloris sp. GSB1 TaxID=281093 RepID=UPI000B8C86CF|nr:hypothetical protein [Prosthecochloris sp. GSB1]ASQ90692.1 hypothetical protein CHL67_06920 [Prosthecochloris sp. GSB1]
MFKRFAATAVATVMFALPACSGHAADVESMKVRCRARGSSELSVDTSNVAVEYEGKRGDGTHAVNATVFVDGREETFQCIFCRSGRRLLQFTVDESRDGPDAVEIDTE